MGQVQPTMGAQLSLCDLYEQHWLHIRHLVNERLSITSLYALLIGGGVIFLFGQSLSKFAHLWVLSFLLLVTLVAGGIALRLGLRLAKYRINVDEIAEAAGLGNYLVPRPMRGGGPFRTQNLLAFIYLGTFIGLALLLIVSLY